MHGGAGYGGWSQGWGGFLVTNPVASANETDNTTYFEFGTATQMHFMNNEETCSYIGCLFAVGTNMGSNMNMGCNNTILYNSYGYMIVQCFRVFYYCCQYCTHCCVLAIGEIYTTTGTWVETIGTVQYENVYSTDSDAYPQNGYQDGYWYILVTD